MEEEDVRSTLPDITDEVLKQPQRDSWTSIDHRYVNGEQEVSVWSETEIQINQPHRTDELSLSMKTGRDTPEEAEQWEQIIWPVRPMTCTSPPLSCATVQWDMPDPTAETSSLMTDSCLASELDSCGVTSLDTTSSLLPSQSQDAELFTQKVREEEVGFDSRSLSSHLERTGNSSEPCDAADVQEPPAQEKEDSTHGLLVSNNENLPQTPQRTDSSEEEGHSATSDPIENVDLIDILKEIESSEDEAESFVDLKLEEEQEEHAVLLSGQGESEEEHTSESGVKDEEVNDVGEGDVDGEHCVTDVPRTEESEEAETASCLSDVEVPAEPPQTADTVPTVNPDKLIDLQQSALLEERQHSGSEEDQERLEWLCKDPTGQSGELEMCQDVDQNVDPKQSEAAQDNKELSTQATDHAERLENSQEIQEQTENSKETRCQDFDQTTSKQPEMTKEPEHVQAEEWHSKDQSTGPPENADLPEEHTPLEQMVCVEAGDPGEAEQQQQTEPLEQKEQTSDSSQPVLSEQLVQPEETSEITEQLPAEAEVTQQTEEDEFNQVDKQAEMSQQPEGSEEVSVQTVVANGGQHKAVMNGGDRETARRLAEQLYKLEDFQRVDVVKHLDKDNDFSRAVGEEYLRFFDFTGQALDRALRSFLKVVVLIGETQERERVLQHFACRYHQCNPESFCSSGSVLALTCALMLLNTDLHGQNVGKSMSSAKFVSNLDEMNEGDNFSKDLLKSLYNSIKSEPLEWAVDEEELKGSVLVDEDTADDVSLRSKANPFQDLPHDKKATVVKEGFLQRKLHADIDGKRTPWGKRSWKTFYGVLRGMVLYLHKTDYRRDQLINEEVVSVHHSLAEQAADYTKKPHVFRLQTADWRVFLFQAASKLEMNSWISRINLVSALHSSPPFPAAVGSQRRFFRPILPAMQSAHTLEHQLQSHSGMLESFKVDLLHLQENLPEGKKAKAKELEEQRVRAEYLQHEICRHENYIQVLEAWSCMKKTDDDAWSIAGLTLFDKAMCADSVEEEEEEAGLKKSYSSPSLELESPPPTVVKVRRNISERRTYRRPIIPRWNKEA